MQDTTISWAETSWNPTRGCSRVSPGCTNCYAESVAARFSGPGLPFEGYAKRVGGEARWTNRVGLIPEKLGEPLRRRKPSRVFVNSMSDLFHEGLANEEVAAVFGVMAACPQHEFMVLTKRPQRMLEWLRWVDSVRPAFPSDLFVQRHAYHEMPDKSAFPLHPVKGTLRSFPWPLLNVMLGVSAENQETADERIPLLLKCPAASRFVSAEPLLGPVSLGRYLLRTASPGKCVTIDGEWWHTPGSCPDCLPALDLVIIGGESGRNARPCDVQWIRSAVEQCREVGTSAFVKQLGARPHWPQGPEECEIDWLDLADPKGEDVDEWPEDLRVREWPTYRRERSGP